MAIKIRDLVLEALKTVNKQHVFKGRVVYRESKELLITPDCFTKKEFEQQWGDWPLALKEFCGFFFDEKMELVEFTPNTTPTELENPTTTDAF